MSRLTIRWRVTLVAVSVLALALLLVGVVANVLLTQDLKRESRSVLRNRAAAQSVTLERKNGKVVVRESANDETLDEQSWVFSDGRAVERTRSTPKVARAAEALAGVNRATFVTVEEKVRLYARPAYADDGTRLGTIVVGVSLRPYERSERIARTSTIALILFALVAAAFAVYWAVGRALSPVDEMTRRAADWSAHDLHRRFGIGPARDEISALAATLDSLLSRIDAAMQREQRVTAEIAHELRTPLSSLRAEAELRIPDASAEEAESLRRIVSGADRMNAAIETLLAAHRGDTPAGQTCDPVVAAQHAVESFRESRPDWQWETRGQPGRVIVSVDEPVLIQTLAPLLDNAARHAKDSVTVEVVAHGGQVTLAVLDDGPGIDGPLPGDIFAPGISGGDRAGLGLPLARRLAQSFGADLIAVEDDGGRFELRMDALQPD